MEANELRLGNLFIEQHSKTIISVIGLEKNRIIFDGMFLEKWQAVPIPLTPNWLYKLGFENKNGEWTFKGVCFQYFNHNLYFTAGEGIPFGIPIEYVHELQNFCYAINKTELICKQPY